MDKLVSSFQLKEYNVDNIQFTSNEHYEPKPRIKLDFDIDSEVILLSPEEKITKVILTCVLFKNYKRTNKPFKLKVSINGVFQFKGDVSHDQLMKFSEVNATAVLFPYLRAAITQIAVVCNQPPLLLPLINVNEFIKSKKKGTEKKEE